MSLPLPPETPPLPQLGPARNPLAPHALWEYACTALMLAARQVRALDRLLLVLACAVALMTLLLWLLSVATATPMALLTRDVAATLGAKFYIGVLSNIGALLWAAAATVCAFGATTLRGVASQRERRGFLLGAALLTAALGADDFFMLHEVVYPKLGLEEHWVVLLYGMALAALLLRFRDVVLASDVLLLTIAMLLFGVSVLVDGLVRDATATEDLFKVAGVLVWLTYFWRVALAGLSARPGT